jgi:hypothetical protein
MMLFQITKTNFALQEEYIKNDWSGDPFLQGKIQP